MAGVDYGGGRKNNLEGRLDLWPTYSDADGVVWSNKAYGDYPTYFASRRSRRERYQRRVDVA